MAKKKKRKRNAFGPFSSLATDLVGTGVGLGVGAATVGALERQGGVSTGVGTAFSTASGFVPITTVARMGKMTIKHIEDPIYEVHKTKKRKRR